MMRRLGFLLLLALLAAPAGAEEDAASPFFVRQLQQHLLLHGYDAGPATGEVTARTRWAVARYRRDAALPEATDLLDVLAHLRFAAPRITAETKPGRKGADDAVAAAQLLLVKLGWLEGPVDGRLGDETRAAIGAWRAAAGLPGTDDGVDDTLLASLVAAAERQRIKVPPIVAALAAESG